MSETADSTTFEHVEEMPAVAGEQATEAAGEPTGAGAEGRGKASVATLLVALAQQLELFHTPDKTAYATLPIDGHLETHRIRDRDFSHWLRDGYDTHYGRVPGAQAMADAIATLEARAQIKGRAEEVYVRVAGQDGAIFIDLGDAAWRAIEVTPQGWQIICKPPVKFRRTKAMMPLPVPESGGHIEELRPFVNVSGDDAFTLIVAWLVAAMRPKGPYPVLVLQGEQASAKSTTGRVLRHLVDRSKAPLRRLPRSERDLMIGAANAWVQGYDNLSGLSVLLSDAICSLATGGGLATRELYSNDQEFIFEASRPVMMNGIDTIAERPDLEDRALVVMLPRISDTQRRTEDEFRSAFEKAAPRVLGALLDGVSAALRNVGNVKLKSTPRMADFAAWATAAEAGFGWTAGRFMDAYAANRAVTVHDTVDADLVSAAVVKFLSERPPVFEGSAADLLTLLNARQTDQVLRSRGWPQAPNALTARLRRVAPALRAIGVTYDDLPRRGPHGARRLRLSRADTSPMTIADATAAVGDLAEDPAANAAEMITVSAAVEARSALEDAQTADTAAESDCSDGADGTDGLSDAVSQVGNADAIVTEVL